MVGSLAHYYKGEHMLDTIVGLSPNKEEHQTTIDIEPVGTRVVTNSSCCQNLTTFTVSDTSTWHISIHLKVMYISCQLFPLCDKFLLHIYYKWS